MRLFRSSYLYSYVTTSISKILGKDDLLEVLKADSLDNAVKIISNKPLGLHLYKLLVENKLSLKNINEALTEYLMEKHSKLYREAPAKARKYIELLDRLYDALNLALFLDKLSSGGKPEYLLHTGLMFRERVTISDIENVEQLIERLVEKKMHVYANTLKRYKVNPLYFLYKLVNTIMPRQKTLDLPYRRLLGFTHDFLWIMVCSGQGEIPANLVPRLYYLSLNEFNNICLAKNIEEVAVILQGGYYKEYAEILRHVFRLGIGVSALLLAYALYTPLLVFDLIRPYTPHPYIRYYTLLLSENILANACLTAVSTDMFRKELGELINRWWIL